MRITNSTSWDSNSLKKLFSKCRQEIVRREGKRGELSKPKVSIIYQRGARRQDWIGGYAYYNSNVLTMKMPHEKFETTHITDKKVLDFSQCVADTYIHEVGHNLGVHHTSAAGFNNRTIEHMYRQWVLDNISNEKFPLYKVEPKAIAKPKVDLKQKRYEQALKRLAKAEKEMKSSKRLFDKWRIKVRYYERSFAMANKSND